MTTTRATAADPRRGLRPAAGTGHDPGRRRARLPSHPHQLPAVSGAEDDPNPGSAIGKSLAIDLAKKVDEAYFGTKGSHPVKPAGLSDLNAITTVPVTGAITNADPFIDALAAAEAAYGQLTSFVAHPTDVVKLAKLKKATASNEPLLQIDPTATA